MWNARLDESKAGIKISRRNINNLRYAYFIYAESEEELKSLLMRVKEEGEKAGLKFNIQKLRSWHPVHHFMANRWGRSINSGRFYFLGLQNYLEVNCCHGIKRCMLLVRKAMINLDSMLKSRDIINKSPYSQSYSFSSSHVQMWELDHKAGWVLRNWCFLTVVLEKTLESPLDSKEIKPVNPKGNQCWIFEKPTHWKRPWG